MVLPAQHALCRAGVLKRGSAMTDQELAKIANEVRRGIVAASMPPSRGIRADRLAPPTL